MLEVLFVRTGVVSLTGVLIIYSEGLRSHTFTGAFFGFSAGLANEDIGLIISGLIVSFS